MFVNSLTFAMLQQIQKLGQHENESQRYLFASNERATSSVIALNFNQVGIAAALVVGGLVVDGEGLK